MIAARMISPVDTEAKLFFSLKGAEFDEKNSRKVDVKKGENWIHLYFVGLKNTEYSLRFDLGMTSGEYVFLPMPDVNTLMGGKNGL